MLRHPAGILLLAFLALAWASPPTSAPQPRRILLISIDTLRADSAGTPRIEALAADSVVFRRAYAPAPWTLPALASVMSGVSPRVHLATGLGDRMPERVTTVAEVLRRAGFRTAALVSSPLLGKEVNLDQGFQEYTVFPKGPEDKPANPDQLAGLASRWIGAHARDRFLLWIHIFDPHIPWDPPASYLQGMKPPPGMASRLTAEEHLAIRLRERDPSPAEREWLRQLYRAEVRWVDAAVGSLVEALKRSSLYEDTLIVLLSDHGEELWDHGGVGHGHTLYEELLRVPLLVKLPGGVRRGGVDVPVSTSSLAATLLDLCDKPFPRDYPAAPSLRPYLLPGGSAPDSAPLLATGLQRIEDRGAVLFGDFKLVRGMTSGREEFYDLSRDPGETVNLASTREEKTAEGRRLLDRFEAEAIQARKRLGIDRERVPIDPELAKRLRALGY